MMYRYVSLRLGILITVLASDNIQVIFSLLHRLQRLGEENGEPTRALDGQWKAYPLEVR